MAKLIAKTYGNALFELAAGEAKLTEYLNEFQVVCEALRLNPGFGSLMAHPKILKDEKIAVLKNVFKGRVSAEMTGFLELLLVKDRFADLEAIFAYFAALVKEALGIGVAYVTTARALNEIQKSNVRERLIELTDYTQMEMNFAVDEKLIGGMVVRIGDRVVDSSIATTLNNLKRQLLKVQL